MKYEEIKQDLFKTDKKYALGHCVAQDGGLGAGIAVQFCKLFGNRLRTIIRDANPSIPDVVYYYSNNRKRGVYNIVTKKYSGGKPTRISFDKSIEILRDKMIENDDKFLAIPLIGAGLDRLSWAENRETLQRVFADTDIEILVCIR